MHFSRRSRTTSLLCCALFLSACSTRHLSRGPASAGPSPSAGTTSAPSAAPTGTSQPTSAALQVVLGGSRQDVSRAPDNQNEVAAASSRETGRIVAASNSGTEGALRVSSTTGGTWVSERLVPLTGHSGMTDPAVAVLAGGTALLGFVTTRLRDGQALVHIARQAPGGSWRIDPDPLAAPTRGTLVKDAKVSLLADTSAGHRGRVYAVWTRIGLLAQGVESIELSRSDDGGRTWAPPVEVDSGILNDYPSVATSADGTVYVGWLRSDGLMAVTRSRNGGQSYEEPLAVPVRALPDSGRGGCYGWLIPASPHCGVRPTPQVVVDGASQRIFLTYDDQTPGRRQAVFVRSLSPDLHEVGPAVEVAPVQGQDDFLPAPAVAADGTLWLCFYRSGAGPGRDEATWTCAASRDGRTFSPPVPVAQGPSRETSPAAGARREFGDYEAVTPSGAGVVTLWTDSTQRATSGDDIRSQRLQLS